VRDEVVGSLEHGNISTRLGVVDLEMIGDISGEILNNSVLEGRYSDRQRPMNV
jgi:hypothetical protein